MAYQQKAAKEHEYAIELLERLGIKHRFGNRRGDIRLNPKKNSKRAMNSALRFILNEGYEKCSIPDIRADWTKTRSDDFRNVFEAKSAGIIMVAIAYWKHFEDSFPPSESAKNIFEVIKERVQDSEAAAKALLLGEKLGYRSQQLKQFVLVTTAGLGLGELANFEITIDNFETLESGERPPLPFETIEQLGDFARADRNRFLNQSGKNAVALLLRMYDKISPEHRNAALYTVYNLKFHPTDEVFERMLDVFEHSRVSTASDSKGHVWDGGVIRLVEAWNLFRVSTPEEVEMVAEGVRKLPNWHGAFLNLEGHTQEHFAAILKVAKEEGISAEEFPAFVDQVSELPTDEILVVLHPEKMRRTMGLQKYLEEVRTEREARLADQPLGRT